MERPMLERNGMQDHVMDRAEIRNALQNWQKSQILHEQGNNKAFLKGRSAGDGKPAGKTYFQPSKAILLLGAQIYDLRQRFRSRCCHPLYQLFLLLFQSIVMTWCYF